MAEDLPKNRIALVTGASRGIGRVIAMRLAREGIRLALSASSPDSLKGVAGELADLGADFRVQPADLADPVQIAGLVGRTVDAFGGLDIVIANAGVAIPAPLLETTVEQWDRQMAVNARAPFLLCREAVPFLRKSSSPSIIMISSVLGTKGYVNQGAYTASKHALMGMTKVLAQELQEEDIRVHVVSPGAVGTEMVKKTRPDLHPDALIAPEAVADAVWFLLENRSSAVIDELHLHRIGKAWA